MPCNDVFSFKMNDDFYAPKVSASGGCEVFDPYQDVSMGVCCSVQFSAFRLFAAFRHVWAFYCYFVDFNLRLQIQRRGSLVR